MKRLAHKIALLSTAIIVMLFGMPTRVLADAGTGENEYTQTVNGYQVTLVFEKPAVVGNNQIHVSVVDAFNMPVSSGYVEVGVVKAESEHAEVNSGHGAHGGTSHVPEQAEEVSHEEHAEMGMTRLTAGHHGGEYSGEIVIDATGEQMIRVHLTVDGVLTEVDFPMQIEQSQNGSGILAGFFAVNVAIIAAAVILKPKPVSVTLSKGV
jgi:hypothetical protein